MAPFRPFRAPGISNLRDPGRRFACPGLLPHRHFFIRRPWPLWSLTTTNSSCGLLASPKKTATLILFAASSIPTQVIEFFTTGFLPYAALLLTKQQPANITRWKPVTPLCLHSVAPPALLHVAPDAIVFCATGAAPSSMCRPRVPYCDLITV